MKLRSRTKIGQAKASHATQASQISTNATTTSPSSPNPSAASFGPGILSELSTITVNAICPAPIYSFDGILESFPVFDYLPTGVRLMIWREAADLNPRNVPIKTVPHIGPGRFQFQSKLPIPREFFACKDYFGEAKKRYVILDSRLKANDMSLAQHLPPNLWFNPSIDRFCPVWHWTPQEFGVGIRLFFEVLQASKIAVSIDCAEKPEYNLKTWRTIFHHKNIPRWNPNIDDIIYYVTNRRIGVETEPNFVREHVYFLTHCQYTRYWDQKNAVDEAREGMVNFYDVQCEEDETAISEGRPRVKMLGVPQWLYDLGQNWSEPNFEIMLETRSRYPANPDQLLWN